MGVVSRPVCSDVPRAIIDAFRFDGQHISSERMRGGHIHQSFLVACRGARYVLQRLNDQVFPDLAAMVSNVERIVTHLAGDAPQLVTTREGLLSHHAPDGSRWRAFRYLEGTVGRAAPQSPSDAYEAGRAFSLYARTLASLPGPSLDETIELFHGLQPRMQSLEVVAHSDPVGRRNGVLRDLDQARRLCQQLEDSLLPWTGLLPVRTVHNDAKLSNVRFDVTTGDASFVIDFDTTMSGHVQYDVGELVRTVTTHAPEDAGEEHSVDFDLELLAALADGYLVNWPELERSEVEVMALAGPQMAVENALRFLSDYLAGDQYYVVDRPHQNIDRCRTQLQLAELMLDSHSEAESCFARSRRQSHITGSEPRPGQDRP